MRFLPISLCGLAAGLSIGVHAIGPALLERRNEALTAPLGIFQQDPFEKIPTEPPTSALQQKSVKIEQMGDQIHVVAGGQRIKISPDGSAPVVEQNTLTTSSDLVTPPARWNPPSSNFGASPPGSASTAATDPHSWMRQQAMTFSGQQSSGSSALPKASAAASGGSMGLDRNVFDPSNPIPFISSRVREMGSIGGAVQNVLNPSGPSTAADVRRRDEMIEALKGAHNALAGQFFQRGREEDKRQRKQDFLNSLTKELAKEPGNVLGEKILEMSKCDDAASLSQECAVRSLSLVSELKLVAQAINEVQENMKTNLFVDTSGAQMKSALTGPPKSFAEHLFKKLEQDKKRSALLENDELRVQVARYAVVKALSYARDAPDLLTEDGNISPDNVVKFVDEAMKKDTTGSETDPYKVALNRLSSDMNFVLHMPPNANLEPPKAESVLQNGMGHVPGIRMPYGGSLPTADAVEQVAKAVDDWGKDNLARRQRQAIGVQTAAIDEAGRQAQLQQKIRDAKVDAERNAINDIQKMLMDRRKEELDKLLRQTPLTADQLQGVRQSALDAIRGQISPQEVDVLQQKWENFHNSQTGDRDAGSISRILSSRQVGGGSTGGAGSPYVGVGGP
uniref:Secreted protein n=1 Tax=Chromera velia CCMP2878 TaxID=1169474 RepID=A0A0G4HAF7_9ALVE|eukprot:Cvel_900.t1-p1 / transcript=Cvel_900.t1 / gene=Cvel_900 / organism=Chromera_velia_CCMP2878 / gene_product=hypothetical protein / transcript_product=hypothetical protein / location=Cvel_scaffold28:119358-121840(-) / protein_length=620 / sequence_SO=supercontig / SO=protein_coding / is_pseudo=false